MQAGSDASREEREHLAGVRGCLVAASQPTTTTNTDNNSNEHDNALNRLHYSPKKCSLDVDDVSIF